MTLLTIEIIAAANRTGGHGRNLALPFLEAMLPAAPGAAEARPAVSGVLHAERNGDGILVAERRRAPTSS